MLTVPQSFSSYGAAYSQGDQGHFVPSKDGKANNSLSLDSVLNFFSFPLENSDFGRTFSGLIENI